jgi:hypothetical protein
VTTALNLISHHIGVFDIKFWSTQISFFLIAVMSVASIRGILVQFAKISLSVTTSLSSDTLLLLLTHLMGFYFQSVILLLRNNLPIKYRYLNLTFVNCYR